MGAAIVIGNGHTLAPPRVIAYVLLIRGCCGLHGKRVENDVTELHRTLLRNDEMDVFLRNASHPFVHQ